MITIENKHISAQFKPYGAELKSLKNKSTDREYIWQADPEFWNRSAPLLFPIVGEVTHNAIKVDGTQYSLGRHGFARDLRFEVSSIHEAEVEYYLKNTEETLEKYPFKFRFSVTYAVKEHSLITKFSIKNTDEKPIYFSVGAHPAFNLPSGNIEDYYIEFEQPETLYRHLLANNTFSGEKELIVENTTRLPLSSALFDKDAIVFKDMKSQQLTLKDKLGDYAVKMSFEGFPYFGIWTKPNCERFVCLEPWCGLADTAGFNGEFKDKEGIVSLAEGETFNRTFSTEIA